MYAKLKQAMTDAGYNVSEGDGWAATDTEQFTAFSRFVLGMQHVSPTQVMAYPQAFPVLASVFSSSTDSSALEKTDPAKNDDPMPPAEPEAPAPQVEDSPAQADDVMDVSGGAGEAPQVLEQPVLPEAPAADEDEVPAEDIPAAADEEEV